MVQDLKAFHSRSTLYPMTRFIRFWYIWPPVNYIDQTKSELSFIFRKKKISIVSRNKIGRREILLGLPFALSISTPSARPRHRTMAPSISTGSVSALRAISYRIGSVPASQLPHVACSVSQSVRSCRELLSQPHSARQSDGEAGVVVHRLNTQIATLLQGRSAEERFAATVLIKAMIEAGGWEVLSKSKHWVIGLINNLKKNDPPSTKTLNIITITRIFMLTWEYPTLIREITTPSLAGYISTCLGLLQSRQNGLKEHQSILESLATLVPRHPTVFRNHVSEINRLIEQEITAQTQPASLRESAARLASLLHQCEPKQGSSLSWERSFENLLKTTHSLADKVLIGIEEDWQPAGQSFSDKQSLQRQYDRTDASGRVAALYDGSKALIDYLERLRAMIITSTGAAVSLPITSITDLTIRLFATTVSLDSTRGSVRYSSDVIKEEKDVLTSILPRMHVRALSLILALLDRSEDSMSSMAQLFLDNLSWLYESERGDVDVRTSCYVVLGRLLHLVGPSLSKDSIEHLSSIIRGCCGDVLTTGTKFGQNVSAESKGATNGQSHNNADAFLRQPGQTVTKEPSFKGLQSAAEALLHVLLGQLPASNVSEARRTQLDRTAVLTRQKNALVASILNPLTKQKAGRSSASLLPFLSREYAHEAEVESLLRPRMPVVRSKHSAKVGDVEMEEDEPVVDEQEDAENYSGHEDQMNGRSDVTATSDDLARSSETATRTEHEGIGSALLQDTQRQNDSRITDEIHTASSGTKRQHEEVEETQTEAKRQRASPVARSLLASEREDLPGNTTTATELPRTVLINETSDLSRTPAIATLPVEGPRQSATAADASDDNDDDFVVPPLDLHDSDDDEDDEEERST